MEEQKQKFGIFRLLALCALVGVLMVAPPLFSTVAKNNKITGQELWGEKSEYQGVLEIWNVDTFSGASMSKTDYLNAIARSFESENKGVYVCVKNLKVEEFKIALGEGKRPSIVSFGSGLGSTLKDELSELTIFDNPRQSILESGMDNGTLKAVGYIMGAYSLFSTSDRLVGLAYEKLSDIALTAGITTQTGKNTKHIYSLNYGKSEFLHPEKSIALNLVGSEEVYQSVSDYDAYVDYCIFNKSNILLGNMRDLVRLENKVNKGDMSDIVLEPLVEYNDQIQYLGIINSSSESLNKCASYFVNYVMSESSQLKIANTGLFSTTRTDLYQEGNFRKVEEVIDKVKNIPNVFL